MLLSLSRLASDKLSVGARLRAPGGEGCMPALSIVVGSRVASLSSVRSQRVIQVYYNG